MGSTGIVECKLRVEIAMSSLKLWQTKKCRRTSRTGCLISSSSSTAWTSTPGEDEWTVILNRTAEQWGAFNYDQGEDALRVMVTPGSGEHVESMDFVIEGDAVVLRWGELTLPIRISAP